MENIGFRTEGDDPSWPEACEGLENVPNKLFRLKSQVVYLAKNPLFRKALPQGPKHENGWIAAPSVRISRCWRRILVRISGRR